MMLPMDKIKQVVAAAGGVSALATKLGVKPPTVHQWMTGLRPVPARFALALQAAWPQLVNAAELRPDVFGQPPAVETAEAG